MRKKKARKTGIALRKYKHFSEQLTDRILDPRQPWIIQYLLAGGFSMIAPQSRLTTSRYALDVLSNIEQVWVQPTELVEALFNGDRAYLSSYFERYAIKRRLTHEKMTCLLDMADPSVFKRSLKQLLEPFKFHRGPKPKIPISSYSRLLEKADQLRPVVTSLLNQASETTHTISEILEYLRKDHPEGCRFLLTHINRLQQALNDSKLLKRAKKRTAARARVISDAMAGTEFGLQFSTSIERVRQARRSAAKKSA